VFYKYVLSCLVNILSKLIVFTTYEAVTFVTFLNVRFVRFLI